MSTLTAALLIDDLSADERARAEHIEAVLPALRDAAADADARAEFQVSHIKTLSEALK